MPRGEKERTEIHIYVERERLRAGRDVIIRESGCSSGYLIKNTCKLALLRPCSSRAFEGFPEERLLTGIDVELAERMFM